MPIVNEIKHRFEINPLACGQAVISMLSGLDFKEVFSLVGTEKETTFKDMKTALNTLGITVLGERKQANAKNDLPNVALLSLETPKCWHWSLFANGKFYDPEHGILDDFPKSERKYFWELKNSI